MSILRRIRGVIGTALTWGVAASVIHAVWVGSHWILGPSSRFHTPYVFFTSNFFTFLFGTAAGTIFAVAILISARRSSAFVRSPLRMALGGFLGAALLPMASGFVFPGYVGFPSATAFAAVTLFFGGIGASLASGTALIARRRTPLELAAQLRAPQLPRAR